MNNRKILIASASVFGGFGGFWIYLLPHTFQKENAKNLFHLYDEGLPASVPENVAVLKDNVLDEMKIPEAKRKSLSLFMVYGFDFRSFGTIRESLLNYHGSCIGVPCNVCINAIEGIHALPLTIDEVPIRWNIPESSEFAEALLLSEDAQKFGLAREIALVDSSQIYVKATTMGFSSGIATAILRLLHFQKSLNKLGLVVAYGCTFLFSLSLFLFLNDGITRHYENYSDAAAAKVGKSYTEGAVEFYEKIIKRNIALRILSVNGEKFYTKFGNEVTFIREKHVPYTKRVKNMQNLLESEHK